MTPIQLGSTFQVGKQHIQFTMPCQDVAIAVKDQSLIVLALSDGMGSCGYAELGAQFAVSFIRENAKEIHGLLDYSKGANGEIVWKKKNGAEIFRRKMFKILQRMQDEANEYTTRIGIEIDDMHCTLSFAIIGPTKMITGSIGDSPLYIKANEGFTYVNGNGELDGAKNITYSAYDFGSDVLAVSAGFTEDLQAILMMSDGCLGFQKGDSLEAMANDFPTWFYDVAQGRISTQDAVKKLVEAGYDDCSFSYYANM